MIFISLQSLSAIISKPIANYLKILSYKNNTNFKQQKKHLTKFVSFLGDKEKKL